MFFLFPFLNSGSVQEIFHWSGSSFVWYIFAKSFENGDANTSAPSFSTTNGILSYLWQLLLLREVIVCQTFYTESKTRSPQLLLDCLEWVFHLQCYWLFLENNQQKPEVILPLRMFELTAWQLLQRFHSTGLLLQYLWLPIKLNCHLFLFFVLSYYADSDSPFFLFACLFSNWPSANFSLCTLKKRFSAPLWSWLGVWWFQEWIILQKLLLYWCYWLLLYWLVEF